MDLLNVPNAISVSRIPLAFLFIHFFQKEQPYLSACVMALIMLSDLADGYTARKMGIESKAGNFIDRLSDNVAVVAVLVFFTEQQLLPAWILVALIMRELIVLDFRYTLTSFEPIAASKQRTSFLGKTKMALLMVAMMTMVFRPNYAVVLFYIAVICSMLSSWTYLKNLPLLSANQSTE